MNITQEINQLIINVHNLNTGALVKAPNYVRAELAEIKSKLEKIAKEKAEQIYGQYLLINYKNGVEEAFHNVTSISYWRKMDPNFRYIAIESIFHNQDKTIWIDDIEEFETKGIETSIYKEFSEVLIRSTIS